MIENQRNNILDVGRFFAILSVMLFHYYSAWAHRGSTAYPYGCEYDYFQYGHLGVQFFFILTGFFITDSLYRSSSFINYWKKKIVRLCIPLVICSSITYICFLFLDKDGFIPASSKWQNLLVSCQLISPNVFNAIFDWDLEYINHSYWFLWVEFQFLLFVSVIYFCNRNKFIEKFSIYAFTYVFVWYILRRIMENYFLTNKFGLPFSAETVLYFKEWIWIFNLPMNFVYLIFGMICNTINNNTKDCFIMIPVFVLSFFVSDIYTISTGHIIIWFIMIVFLLLTVKYVRMSSCVSVGGVFARLGRSSYWTYLIHEYIGILIIHRFAYIFGVQMWILPLLLIFLMFFFGYCCYKYIEKPINNIYTNIDGI